MAPLERRRLRLCASFCAVLTVWLVCLDPPARADAQTSVQVINEAPSTTERAVPGGTFTGPAGDVEFSIDLWVSQDHYGVGKCVRVRIRNGSESGTELGFSDETIPDDSTDGHNVAVNISGLVESSGTLVLTTESICDDSDIYSDMIDATFETAGWEATPGTGGGSDDPDWLGMIGGLGDVVDAIQDLADNIASTIQQAIADAIDELSSLLWDPGIPAEVATWIDGWSDVPPLSWFVEIAAFIDSAVPTVTTGAAGCASLPGGQEACISEIVGDVPGLGTFINVAVDVWAVVTYIFLIRATWQSVRN